MQAVAAMGTLETMPPPEPHPDLDAATAAIVRAETSRFLFRAVGMRGVASPAISVVSLFVIWLDPVPWRLVLMGFVSVAALLLGVGSAVRSHRTGQLPRFLGFNLATMAALQLLVVSGTGGLESPLLVILVPLVFVLSITLGRRPEMVAVLATQLVGVTLLALYQVRGWGPDLRLPVLTDGPQASTLHILTIAAVMCGVLVAGRGLGIRLRDVFESMVRSGLEAREAQVVAWTAWSRDLEVIGGEIAHELKNPLASIKGLSALVARDLPDGRTAERMGVLRGEVERMVGILEEFLTFSRPLSPLTLQSLDARELGRRVLEMHEGLAAGRGVTFVITGGAAPVVGDQRKLVQVLVNLIQNALDAAPRGSVVQLAVRGGDEVVVEVLDRGPGLAPEVAEHWGNAGVTTKRKGTGMGLTIASAVLRQHEGVLELEPREGGGLVARMRMPARGPRLTEEAA